MSDFQRYNPGKDKGNLHTRSNTRLNNRDMIDMELFGGTKSKNNIYIEREEFFKNSKIKNFNENNEDNDSFEEDNFNNFANVNNNTVNRITDLDFNNFKDANRGMPIRDINLNNKRYNKDNKDDDANFIIKK